MDPKLTPDSDVPPEDWRDHPEGFEDGYDEDWEGEPAPHVGELPVKIVSKWTKGGTDTATTRACENQESYLFYYADGDVQEGYLLPPAWEHLREKPVNNVPEAMRCA